MIRDTDIGEIQKTKRVEPIPETAPPVIEPAPEPVREPAPAEPARKEPVPVP